MQSKSRQKVAPKVKKDKNSLQNFFEDDEDDFIRKLNQGLRENGQKEDSDSELSGLEDYQDP